MPKATCTTFARDQQIAALAASGMRQGEIAKRLGLHRNSVWKRLAQPQVQAAIEQVRAQVFEESCTLLAERLDAIRAQGHEARRARENARRERRKERRSRATPWQAKPLPRQDQPFDPYQPIRDALAQGQAPCHQPEAEDSPQDTPPAGQDGSHQAQLERAYQAQLEALKRWEVP